ncbi:MAG TPA: translation elongation factor Ts [Acidimicrobiia bacterium]|jgi:elongation factor Ts|nr:translation elongation factor Ts [Acidimicrobiia bacterium]
MADISAKDVAALRKVTGAGMMDCKRALEESEGDIEKAKTWLREKGLAAAGKRAGRAASQGTVDVYVDGNVGAVVELTSETDFVAKGDGFKAAVATLAKQVAEQGEDIAAKPYAGDPSQTVDDFVKGMAGSLGENIGLGRVARFEVSDGLIDAYKHIQQERGMIGVLVELTGVDPSDPKAVEIGHDIALHIASAAPRWVTRDDVPADVVEAEKAVLENLTRNEGKPEQAIPKIVEGRIGGFFKDNCLVEQGFVRDPKVTVGSLISGLGADAKVTRFARIKVGEE